MSPERVVLWLLAGITISSIATWILRDSVFDGATAFAILSCLVAAIWGFQDTNLQQDSVEWPTEAFSTSSPS